jgi:hypothetical protein
VRRKRNKRAETLNRDIVISSFRVSLRVGVDEPRDLQPEIEVKRWLELRGVLSELLHETSDVVLSLYPDPRTKVGPARPPAVGAIIGIRSAVDAVINLPHAEFDRTLVIRTLRTPETCLDGVHEAPRRTRSSLGDLVLNRARRVTQLRPFLVH